MISGNTIYKKKKGIEFSIYEEEGVILLIDTGEFFSLNRTGTNIIKLINGKNNVGDIIRNMSQKHDIEEGILKKDIISFFSLLLKNNIISKNG